MEDPDDPYSPDNLSWNWRFGGPKWRPFSGRWMRGPRVPPPPWARSPKPSKAEREQEKLAEVVDELTARGIVFAVAGAEPQLRGSLDRYGITEKIGAEHYFDSLHAARDAFHHA